MGGTFKIVPELCFQLYTVQVQALSSIVPCLYILLPNKTEVTYRHVLDAIKVFTPLVNPETITTDFEKAAITAALDTFPNVEVHGCFFLLCQNIFRKLQTTGHQERYQNDEDFSLSVRMIGALAFVPLGNVVEAFELISYLQSCLL